MRCGLGFGRWSLRRGWGGKLALVALRTFNFEVPFSARSGQLWSFQIAVVRGRINLQQTINLMSCAAFSVENSATETFDCLELQKHLPLRQSRHYPPHPHPRGYGFHRPRSRILSRSQRCAAPPEVVQKWRESGRNARPA